MIKDYKQAKQGTNIIPNDEAWTRQYYVIDYYDRTLEDCAFEKGVRRVSVRHYEQINRFLQSMNSTFKWYGFSKKEDAYNTKDYFQKTLGIINDREQSTSFK